MNKELGLNKELLEAIAKQHKCAYGLKQVILAAQSNAIEILLVTNSFITQKRKEKTFEEIDKIMRSVDTNKGTIIIVSSEHDGGQKLDGIGGIGALLRYGMNF